MRGGVRGGTAWLAATALVAGLAAVTAPTSGAATPSARPGSCKEVIQVWAGGDPGVVRGIREAARFVPGTPDIRTIRVAARPQRQLSADHFERLKRRGLSDPYFKGYRATATRVVDALRQQARRCPESVLVAAGHSEGAVAVRQAVRDLTEPGDRRVKRRLGALLLYGDPLTRRSESRVVPVSHHETDAAKGVLVGTKPRLGLPRWATRAQLATSVCTAYDPVCSRGLNANDIGQHSSYESYLYEDFRIDGFGPDIAEALDYLPTDRVVRVPWVAGQRVRFGVKQLWSQPVRVSAARLPRGLTLRRGVIAGRVDTGRYVARLRVRGKRAAQALTRSVRVVVDVRPQAAAAGTALVSRGVDGQPANGPSSDVHVSADGATVVFASRATNLVDRDVAGVLGDDNASGGGVPGDEYAAVAYAWSASTGEVELLGIDPEGAVMAARPVDVSDDGRFVLLRLRGFAGALVLRDRQLGVSVRVPDPQVAADVSGPPRRYGGASLTSDGSFVDVGIETPGIWRWNRLDGSTRTFPLDTTFAASSPDGQVAAAGGSGYRDIYLRNLTTNVSGPVVPGSGSDRTFWSELSAGGRTMATHVNTIDWFSDRLVLDLERSLVIDRGLAFVPGVSADGEWYTGDARSWELQVRRTDDAAQHDAFSRRPLDAESTSAEPGAAALSGDGGVLAYTSAAVDLLPGVRAADSQVYLWQVAR